HLSRSPSLSRKPGSRPRSPKLLDPGTLSASFPVKSMTGPGTAHVQGRVGDWCMQQRESPGPYSVMIREMHPEDRPRERLLFAGPSALNTAELLAIILNTGISGESVTSISQRLLAHHGGLAGLLRMDVNELAQVRGLGKAKAAKVKAALEIGRRVSMLADEDRPRVGTPEDIV